MTLKRVINAIWNKLLFGPFGLARSGDRSGQALLGVILLCEPRTFRAEGEAWPEGFRKSGLKAGSQNLAERERVGQFHGSSRNRFEINRSAAENRNAVMLKNGVGFENDVRSTFDSSSTLKMRTWIILCGSFRDYMLLIWKFKRSFERLHQTFWWCCWMPVPCRRWDRRYRI